MSLYKRPRSPHWQYDFTVAGKRYRGSTQLESKTAAKAFEARLIVEIEEKGYSPQPQKKSATLLAYIPRFRTWIEQNQHLKSNSKRYYEDGLAVLQRSRLAHVVLGSLTRDYVDTTQFTTVEGTPASPHLANQGLATLRRLVNKAKEWGDLREVPRIRLREAEGRNGVVTPEIESKLLAELQKPTKNPRVAADRERTVDIYLLMHDAGLRTCEAVVARVENIDWAEKTLFVERSKSKRSQRFVPLSDRLLERLKARSAGRKSGWIFPSSRKSKAGHIVSPWKGFRAACRRADVPEKIVLYTGRHTFGTFTVRQTGNVFVVSDAMGHQDIKSMRPYQHHDTAQLAEVINRRNEARHTLRHIDADVASMSDVSPLALTA